MPEDNKSYGKTYPTRRFPGAGTQNDKRAPFPEIKSVSGKQSFGKSESGKVHPTKRDFGRS